MNVRRDGAKRSRHRASVRIGARRIVDRSGMRDQFSWRRTLAGGEAGSEARTRSRSPDFPTGI
jgi:hypothetical protein